MKAMSKPPIVAEIAPVVPEVGSTMIAAGIKLASLGEAVSMTVDPAMSISGSSEVVLMTLGTVIPTAVSMVKSMSILSLVSTTAGTTMTAAASMAESMSILLILAVVLSFHRLVGNPKRKV
jgi:hypothetical protein